MSIIEKIELRSLPGSPQIAFAEAGPRDQPPLVLVHGSLCDYRYWDPQFEALAAHRHVVAVSLPHYFPVADQPVQSGFGIQSHVDALAALFEAKFWTDATLVGHSRGGCVAFHFASQHPAFLSALVLADPGGQIAKVDANGQITNTPLPAAYAPTDPRMRAAEMIDSGKAEEGLALFVDTVSRPGYWQRSGEAFQRMARDNAHTLRMQMRDVLPLYERSEAAGVTMPTLLINGDKSPKPFLATSDVLADWMPYARRTVIRGASHGMNLTHAGVFNQQLLDFICLPA